MAHARIFLLHLATTLLLLLLLLLLPTATLGARCKAWGEQGGTRAATIPLTLHMVSTNTWQVTVPLQDGVNDVTLVAIDLHGEVISSDAIVVTSEGGG